MALVTPRGMSITEAYRHYRDGKLIVNRAYQRKLVWTVEEKRKLIDSILLGYPIPLVLLAQTKEGSFEIIDGMQRLNAIFDFIENNYSLDGERYFDINEFGTAKQALAEGKISSADLGALRLTPKECSDIYEYQLAVTIFPIEDESDVTDIFGRINSGGKHLSAQEKRQAGVISTFSSLVRRIATELRGDPSEDILKLYEMPKISIEGRFNSSKLGYGVSAQDTFWVSQGILNTKELRDSVDEQMIADLIISIVYREPFAASKDSFDDIYNQESEKYDALNSAVTAYSETKLTTDIIAVISVLKDIMRYADSSELGTFKSIIYNGKASNSARSAFYAVFMALHELIILESKAPSDMEKIVGALKGLHKKIKTDRKHVTVEDRKTNIALTKGLIQNYFHNVSPSLAHSGSGLITSFENDLRRSKMESSRFEFKQGILNLYQDLTINSNLLDKIITIMCGMANIGSESLGGNIYFGISDSESDSKKISEIFGIQPIKFAEKDIFGIEHEADKLELDAELYVKKIIQHIQRSKLTEPLKTSVLNNIDHFNYNGRTILRIGVPKQKAISFVGEDAYMRVDSHTYKATPIQVAEIVQRF
ncbi:MULTISPECIES: DUF262 domain-containing protein [Vibrio]|uniref:GmrSD restriction endonuclease domain-containing protein n=1 Tax=Vibrio TaxID=662 RepID=UPI0022777E91|nr:MULTISPECIES: DUF262 domain-containing protein [Vibrio]MBE4123282.1 DUF262 domain-containing protein [Vibrio parahaemolyticus]MDW1969689.1 DUF262 domain-containing protein [Vibrio sp. 945]EIK0773709.1 DUF262 domain-containing protein [Vibrio alginolyticus]EJG1637302.1 DUF262 domain-containing protein [Vibrio alginolyticus]MDW1884251.1 DUF262 domain-containing protein [Vibrio sp. Vb2131]